MEEKSKKGSGLMVLLILAVLIAVAAGAYFLLSKSSEFTSEQQNKIDTIVREADSWNVTRNNGEVNSLRIYEKDGVTYMVVGHRVESQSGGLTMLQYAWLDCYQVEENRLIRLEAAQQPSGVENLLYTGVHCTLGHANEQTIRLTAMQAYRACLKAKN